MNLVSVGHALGIKSTCKAHQQQTLHNLQLLPYNTWLMCLLLAISFTRSKRWQVYNQVFPAVFNCTVSALLQNSLSADFSFTKNQHLATNKYIQPDLPSNCYSVWGLDTTSFPFADVTPAKDISCRYLGELPLGNLRACCLP